MQSIAGSLSAYVERRMVRIFLLGIISGFPWVLIGSALSLWLKEDGLSRTTIGWASLIFGVYAVNFLWAPLIDRLRVPWLTDRLGHRRAWIVTLQAVILACLVMWSVIEPAANLAVAVAVGLVIATASATQDITIDALRIEQVGESESESMAAGAATAVVGWWTGYKLGGVVALKTASAFQNAGVENYWQATFLVLGVVVILCSIGLVLCVCETSPAERVAAQAEEDDRIAAHLDLSGGLGRAVTWLAGTVAGPLMSFFRRNGFAIAVAVLGFIFLFKIGEAFLGRMSLLFYQGNRILQDRYCHLLQGPGLGNHRHLHRAGRVLRGPGRPGAGHVPVRGCHGVHEPVVRGVGLDGQVGGFVRDRGGNRRPHQRLCHRDLRRFHLDAG